MSKERDKASLAEKSFHGIGRGSERVGRRTERWLDRLTGRWLRVPDRSGWEVDGEWARVQQEPIRARALLWVVFFALVALLVWAGLAPIDEVARGDGKVIPSSQLQIVQTLDGGVVETLSVQEGELVKKGQLLVSIESTRFDSDFAEQKSRELALQANIYRLRALIDGEEIRFPPEFIERSPELVAVQKSLFENSRNELEAQKVIYQQQLEQRQADLRKARSARQQYREVLSLASRELSLKRPLLASGAVSEVDLIKLEREISNARGEVNQAEAAIDGSLSAIAEAESKIRETQLIMTNSWRERLSEAVSDLSATREMMSGLSDRVRKTQIVAPVDGTVQRLFAKTVGGVVAPGQDVVEIVPLNDEMLVEARILPKDIAFIHKGQDAIIKFSAYDFAVFGGLKAKVEHISADTITDENDNTYYLTRLRTEVQGFSDQLAIIPGMTAQVDILTGQKTVLEYLLKPVVRATSKALSER
ncbi:MULTISPECIES: HlyD family type I secretion periplasmic adaptor subunit [unclassified Marinobacter]|uniref:HlyD family type I secretion periplasmic adaptor subunit n=1 Tax=unclassified Marinobacter TaxID=83889 RepID=UPI0026E48A40|nr:MULTISPECIES: HlyD family type I secretion periplasmic adaptor subunit [unclassified Marinobacter]MDO6441353.1 HlyD family type I secretion periplasmic adaptor subunit [Marinobacter sp. 2_MG-2023]MDO6822468.1 HlyD family type I secretion periplasmic adaptor subunit [Marinobacter sp. 1_MG-2023]